MRLMVFQELMVSWKEKSWTLIRILGKGPCFLSLLPRHTQSFCQVGSWQHTSDWGNSSGGGGVRKTLTHCLFCEQEGALTSQPQLGPLCAAEDNETRNWVDSDCQAQVTFQAQGRGIGIPGLMGTQGPHSLPPAQADQPSTHCSPRHICLGTNCSSEKPY